MSIDLPFANNALATFVYEPFSYTIANPGSYTLITSNVTSGIPVGYLVNNGSNVVFSTPSNGMGVGTEIFTVTAKDGTGATVAVSSNTVTVGAGRFLDADVSGNSYAGSNFAFYKNEPITPLPLVAPFAISVPTSVPTLPPGLSYTSNDSNSYTISGSPLVTVPQSNYLIIGKGTGSNLGKVVTSQFGLSVSNERVVMNLTGSPIVSNMTVGTPISQRVITSQYPPYPTGGTLRYSWFGLPNGITVTDISGTPQGPTFTPSDPLSTMIISGTPTVEAANAFRNANITSNVVTFTATRLNPLPQISNAIPLTFHFGETVLFDSVTVPTLYSGVALDPSNTYFRAQTYFKTGAGIGISNIFSPDLRSDLSINFVAPDKGYLVSYPANVGPSGVGTGTYTIRAVNSNGISRDLSVPITVATDTMTFVSPTPNPIDACFNFVLSRPISASLTGYYTSNIQFKAQAASGNAVTFSASGLAGTGLSLSNVGSNTVQLVGTPTTVTALTTAIITANAVGTPATADTTFKLEILNDVITFSEPTALQLSFVQNRPITPIQLTATTLSERQVISFTSSDMPSGLTLSTTGVIAGTPLLSTGGTFHVTASTGYMSQTHSYTYTLVPDSIILIERPQSSYALTLGGPIPAATVSGLSYSGTQVSNFVFVSLPITYGMTLNSSTGVFGGTLTTSFPPDVVLPSNVNFSVRGQAGSLTASLPVELNTSNAARYQWFALKGIYLTRTESTLDNWSSVTYTTLCNAFTDWTLRPITVDTRTILAVTNTNTMTYSSNGTSFLNYAIPETPWPFFDNPEAPPLGPGSETVPIGPRVIARKGDTTTLYGVGYLTGVAGDGVNAFFISADEGLTWTTTYPLLVPGVTTFSWVPDATGFGSAIAYKSGVLLMGIAGLPGFNRPIIRSTDEGASWALATTGLQRYVTNFFTETDRWIVAGSDAYRDGETYSTDTRTLYSSDDQGATWTVATSGDFNYIADFVVYGNGVWIAGGRHYNSGDGYIYFGLRYSTDGLTWTTFTLPGTWYPVDPTYIPILGQVMSSMLDSILFDGTDFVIIVTQNMDGSYVPYSFTHAADGSSLTSGWTSTSMGTFLAIGDPLGRAARMKGRYPVSTGPPTPILTFPSTAGDGPTVTSPTARTFLLYQYVTMTPIQLSASGVGTVYFFVKDSELPRGITFNSVTNTLSGTPMLIGETTVTIYVKDDDGVTLLNLGFRVIIPTVERQQTSAGAWTSLVRQYTVVNAAQNSVNGRTLPATEPPLGEFMRPPPPDSVHEDPACKKC